MQKHKALSRLKMTDVTLGYLRNYTFLKETLRILHLWKGIMALHHPQVNSRNTAFMLQSNHQCAFACISLTNAVACQMMHCYFAGKIEPGLPFCLADPVLAALSYWWTGCIQVEDSAV